MNDTGVVMVWGLRESLLNRILTALNRMLWQFNINES